MKISVHISQRNLCAEGMRFKLRSFSVNDK